MFCYSNRRHFSELCSESDLPYQEAREGVGGGGESRSGGEGDVERLYRQRGAADDGWGGGDVLVPEGWGVGGGRGGGEFVEYLYRPCRYIYM